MAKGASNVQPHRNNGSYAEAETPTVNFPFPKPLWEGADEDHWPAVLESSSPKRFERARY